MSETQEPKKNALTLVGPCRFSYANLWRPRQNLKNEMQYDVVLLFPKQNNEFCPDAKKSLDAAKAGIKACAETMIPQGKQYGIPLMDGDKTGKNPGYFYMTAKGSYAPAVVGPDTVPVSEGGEWASGDWGKAILSFYAGEFNGTWNIGCGLRSVQFTKHDEHFGGVGSGVDMFTPEPGYSAPSSGGEPSQVADGEYDPFADTE